MQSAKRIGQFLTALFRHWWQWMSCAAATLLTFYAALTNQNNTWIAHAIVILAVLFLLVAAFGAWLDERKKVDTLSVFVDGRLPKLNVEIRALFWEPSQRAHKPYFAFRVFAYVCTTNTNKPETLLKNAMLSFTATNGIRYTSQSSEADLKYKYIGHHTPFRTGGDVEQDYRTHTPYVELMTEVNGENPLRQGIHQMGFLSFSFPDLQNPQISLTEVVSVTDVELSLVDSYDQSHTVPVPLSEIAGGHGIHSLAKVTVL